MTAVAPVYAAALLAFAAHLAWSHFALILAPGLLASALLGLTALTCIGVGRLALKAFVRAHLSESERTLIGATLGLGVLSLLLFFLAAAHCLTTAAVMVLVGGLWVIAFTEMREVVLSLVPDRSLLGERPGWTAGIGLLLALAFWTAWVPPHQYDALLYHLELPSLYVRHGGLTLPSHLIYAHFPQNAEMLFSFALLLGSDIFAQLLSWLALALSVWWVFELGRREAPLSAALLACGLLASHTGLMLLAATAYVETFVMLWITGAVFCFFRWQEIAEAPEGLGWLGLSGAFAGLAMGTKYYAAICPAVLLLFLLARRPALRELRAFAGLAGLAVAPWLVKNWACTGNPVFPFFCRVLPYWGPAGGLETAERYFRFLKDYAPAWGHAARDLALLPYLAATGSPRLGGGADVLGDLGWAPMVALLPLALLAAVKNRGLRRLTAYCGLHAAAWYASAAVLRFLVVLLPLYCLPVAAGVHAAWNAVGSRGRALLACALSGFLLLNLGLFVHVHTLMSSWSVLSAVESRESYLARRLEYYPCARWSRDHLDRNDRILLVGESRGYHLEQDHLPTSTMAVNRFVVLADAARDPADLRARLRGEGFFHLLLVPREESRLAGYGTMDFSERGRSNWEGLKAGQSHPVFQAPGCSVLELEPSS